MNAPELQPLILDESPRYARVTYLNRNRRRTKFIGRWRRKGDVLIGERKDDDPKIEDGYILNLTYVHVSEVIEVERQNPFYETWEVTVWE